MSYVTVYSTSVITSYANTPDGLCVPSRHTLQTARPRGDGNSPIDERVVAQRERTRWSPPPGAPHKRKPFI